MPAFLPFFLVVILITTVDTKRRRRKKRKCTKQLPVPLFVEFMRLSSLSPFKGDTAAVTDWK